MPTAAAIPIWLSLTTRSNPPVSPIDLNTEQTPQLFRGTAAAIQVAIFDVAGAAVDLSNLAFLNLAIFRVPRSWGQWNGLATPGSLSLLLNGYPTCPPVITESLAAADFNSSTVSIQDWLAQLASQVTFNLSAIQTSLLEVCQDGPSTYALVIQGLTTAGQSIIYGGGPLTVYESGANGVYMPNTVAPLDVPAGAIFYLAPNTQIPFSLAISVEGSIVSDGGILVQDGGSTTPPEVPSNSYHAQTAAAAGVFSVSPTSSNHTEDVDVTASTGTVELVLAIATPSAGDIVMIDLTLPSASGVVVEVFNQSTSGAVLASFTTDGTAQTANGYFQAVYNGTAWEVQRTQLPAHY